MLCSPVFALLTLAKAAEAWWAKQRQSAHQKHSIYAFSAKKSETRIFMKCLIYTQPNDAHAIVVKLVLEKLGHEVQLWLAADQPKLLSHSVSLNSRRTFWESSDNISQHELSEFDTVWLRRLDKPDIPKDLTHPEDHAFVERENRLFFDAMTTLLSTNAWWVNSPQAARKANSKLLQLHIAKKCGLQIPATLS